MDQVVGDKKDSGTESSSNQAGAEEVDVSEVVCSETRTNVEDGDGDEDCPCKSPLPCHCASVSLPC